MDIQCLLWGIDTILRGLLCLGSGNPPPPPNYQRLFDNNYGGDLDDIDATENGRAPAERRCELDDGYNRVNPYHKMETMNVEDWDDLWDIHIIKHSINSSNVSNIDTTLT